MGLDVCLHVCMHIQTYMHTCAYISVYLCICMLNYDLLSGLCSMFRNDLNFVFKHTFVRMVGLRFHLCFLGLYFRSIHYYLSKYTLLSAYYISLFLITYFKLTNERLIIK